MPPSETSNRWREPRFAASPLTPQPDRPVRIISMAVPDHASPVVPRNHSLARTTAVNSSQIRTRATMLALTSHYSATNAKHPRHAPRSQGSRGGCARGALSQGLREGRALAGVARGARSRRGCARGALSQGLREGRALAGVARGARSRGGCARGARCSVLIVGHPRPDLRLSGVPSGLRVRTRSRRRHGPGPGHDSNDGASWSPGQQRCSIVAVTAVGGERIRVAGRAHGAHGAQGKVLADAVRGRRESAGGRGPGRRHGFGWKRGLARD